MHLSRRASCSQAIGTDVSLTEDLTDALRANTLFGGCPVGACTGGLSSDDMAWLARVACSATAGAQPGQLCHAPGRCASAPLPASGQTAAPSRGMPPWQRRPQAPCAVSGSRQQCRHLMWRAGSLCATYPSLRRHPVTGLAHGLPACPPAAGALLHVLTGSGLSSACRLSAGELAEATRAEMLGRDARRRCSVSLELLRQLGLLSYDAKGLSHAPVFQ